MSRGAATPGQAGPASEQTPQWDGPGLEAWQPWTPRQVAAELAGLSAPWCVVGGHAIDLWLGESTRSHEDIEVSVPRDELARVRERLGRYVLHAVGAGRVRRLAPDELPAPHEHQAWVLDEPAGAWRLDVMSEPGDARTWVFRRDPRVRAPRARMVGRRDGIPYLRPAGVLLFKARACRAKDVADFEACLPRLDAPARQWLAGTLARVHPGHAWIARLADRGAPRRS